MDVDEFRTYSESIDDSLAERLRQRTVASLSEIVVDRDIWQLLGSPSALRGFATGYFWKPYEGEVYKPLIIYT